MNITRVSLQSKLDELIQFLHTYLLMKITRVSLQSKLDGLMSLSTRISRVNVCSNDISSSSFDCSETRVILVEEYVWIIKISFPASIAVKQALFSSLDAWW